MYWNSALLMTSFSALGGSSSRLMVKNLSVCFLISVLIFFFYALRGVCTLIGNVLCPRCPHKSCRVGQHRYKKDYFP